MRTGAGLAPATIGALPLREPTRPPNAVSPDPGSLLVLRLLRSVAPFVCLAAVGAPAAVHAQGMQLALIGFQTVAPPNWVPQHPSSSSRLAQFVAPGPDSTSDADVVVYFFGAGQGGDVDANLARWRDQFTTPAGGPAYESVVRDSTGAFPITIAEYRGTYRRGIGMGSPDSVRTGEALVAAIAETPHGTLFLQLFGPEAGVARERDRFVGFVKGLR
jgi:hypothetical protein